MIEFDDQSPDPDRSFRIRSVLETVYHRRAAGEAVDDRTIIDSHPDLMPELAERLRALRRVRQAQEIARQSSGTSDGGAVAREGLSLPLDAIPGYELHARIHEGGQGIVYGARQRSTNREVAIKVLRTGPHVFTGDQIRFEQEAKVLARLKHPNVVTVHDYGVAQGCRYLVMDLVEGRPLDAYLQRNDPDQTAKLRLFVKICDAVHAAHLVGIIHRDLKPSNILVDKKGQPFVVDFGLAKLREDELEQENRPAVTMTGQLVGSLPWLSPEQAEGGSERVSTRTDVHALGLILYYMVTKTHAFSLIGSMRDQLDKVIGELPRRPSNIRKGIDDDLDTIILQCLAKEPERRYEGAGALAADVQRYLALEPIEAKRDSRLYVLSRYVRRNGRILAAVGCTTLVFGVAIAGALAMRQAAEERERTRQVEVVLSEATALIAESTELRESYKGLEHEFREFMQQRVAEYFPPEKDRRMHLLEDEIDAVRARREEAFYTVLDLLRRAEQLGTDPDRVRHIRGELYLQEYFDTVNCGDITPQLEQLRERIYANDPTGRLTERLSEKQTVNFNNLPPRTSAYLFRMLDRASVVPGGQHRLVPVPAGEPSLPVPPGTWTLRVVTGAGSVRPSDLILSIAGHSIEGTVLVKDGREPVQRLDRLVSVDGRPILSDYDIRTLAAGTQDEVVDHQFEFERDGQRFVITSAGLGRSGIEVAEPAEIAMDGGVPAEVWQDGELREMILPTGLQVRLTTQPLFISRAAQIEPRTCYDSKGCLTLESGSYVILFRKAGREDVRFVFSITDSPFLVAQVQLPVVGTTPRGFRYIPVPYDGSGTGPFSMKEHEVTAGEYLQFLNHPRTLERIASTPEPIRFPRSNENATRGGYCTRNEYGRFVLPDSWQPDWPVFGVSWHDAVAYAQWLTETARESGLDHTYSLPTMSDWASASVPVFGVQKFAFGYRFRAKWMSSCFARPTPGVEPVMSFPIDETVYGVYDTAGSISEWLDDWWLEDRGLRRHAGGSWADGGGKENFSISGGNGKKPDEVSNSVGFRVVLRMPLPE